jgi:hypothetical protein
LVKANGVFNAYLLVKTVSISSSLTKSVDVIVALLKGVSVNKAEEKKCCW